MAPVACLLVAVSLFLAAGVSAGDATGSLRTQIADLKEWAAQETAQLGPQLAGVDPKFAGVKRFGEALSARPACNVTTASLTDSSSAYWRARLEMAVDDPSVLLGRALLHARCGEVDRALFMVRIIQSQPIKDSPVGSACKLLAEKLIAYRTARNALIQAGVDAYDAGKIETAQSSYDSVLAVEPSCAWAWHEHFLAMEPDARDRAAVEAGEVDERVANDYRRRVYGGDPFYPYGMFASTGVQAFQLGRRLELPPLLKTRDSFKNGLLAAATIALDIGAFGCGAELFCTAMSVGPDSTRPEAIDGFLYCLHRMGVEDIAPNFKGDNAERIRRVVKAYSERLQTSPFYQALEKKE